MNRRLIALAALAIPLLIACSSGPDAETTADASTSQPAQTQAADPTTATTDAATAKRSSEEARRLVTAAVEDALESSYLFEMTMGISGMPDMGPMTMTAEGAVDGLAQQMQMTMDMSGIFAGMLEELTPQERAEFHAVFGDGTAEMVLDGTVMYMRGAMFSAMTGGGSDGWISADLDQFTPQDLAGTENMFQSPTDLLPMLEQLDAVSGGATEDVRGVATTRWDGVLDLEALLEAEAAMGMSEEDLALMRSYTDSALGEMFRMPVSVWIDDDGLLRRMTLEMNISEPAMGFNMTTVVEMDMFAYGEPVSISVPAPGEVTDMSALLALQ